ncbi:hypothetical protein NCWK1_5431 [Nostoc cycadae WK-1]|uniref:Uncharacterized protein n=2 Tax=Nostoc cycadae TaxID=246795 RepID=A0A2H6LQY8_9NOSO|nr:hypothetical protein NCWK1_5431 [Nostoc cycadae WK-1]
MDTAKPGLAKITGGLYKICDSEGRSIAKFTPPPILETLDWQSLKPTQKRLLEEFEKHWQIIAHWLVYFRAFGVDIKQTPFTLPEFQDKRPLAELYNSQLELCAAVWEVIEIRHHYQTPYHWWESCIVELQQAQARSILDSGGSERNTPLKGEVENGLRGFLRVLKEGEIPFNNSASNQHLYRLYTSAIGIKKDSAKVKKAWKVHLDSLNGWIRTVKGNSDLKAIVHLGWRLYYQDQKRLIPIVATSIKNDS